MAPHSPQAISGVPTIFVSYSWETPEHKEWVFHLSERLRKEGINVILDRWDLPLGGDRTYFMENSVRISDFVLLVCTPTYAQKSNGRVGGVGYTRHNRLAVHPMPQRTRMTPLQSLKSALPQAGTSVAAQRPSRRIVRQK